MGMWTIPKGPQKVDAFSDQELDEFVNELAAKVVKKGMSVPVVMTLEMIKPLSLVSYSAMLALGPLLDLVVDPTKTDKLACVMGDRDRIEALMTAIESCESSGQKEGESGER